ncbi:hypothetical protein B0T18DRAFT_428431 [Schizothecium vesticola]|uniref:Uncharacterized protein n=1 Tax=Schizothecium vesticola TaxID=314040 RepID=A0AA40K980_9PEZI|nr:hypothetical protein B0T18DRAFT_428431 [Schizothecium vesticola]
MAPLYNLLWQIYLGVETQLVAQILKIPAFHHGVRRIHRAVEDLRHGRNPNEPLYPGEATENPEKSDGFFRHFTEELRNQFRGTPTEPPPAKQQPPAKKE